jgi:hypothetical protein
MGQSQGSYQCGMGSRFRTQSDYVCPQYYYCICVSVNGVLTFNSLMLLSEDVTPRWWPNNIPPSRESTYGTLGEFYLLHNRQANPKPYQQCPPGRFGKKVEGRYIVLFALIKVGKVSASLSTLISLFLTILT